jgi:hypothetical protein
MTGRPRPKIRAKVQQDSQSSLNSTESQPTTTTASTNLAIAVSDEDGQDLFAYRRQRMRSLADDPESTMRLHTPPILEDEDKRKKRRYKNKLPEWTRVQSWSEGGSEVEIEAEESRPASRAGSRAGSVSRSVQHFLGSSGKQLELIFSFIDHPSHPNPYQYRLQLPQHQLQSRKNQTPSQKKTSPL